MTSRAGSLIVAGFLGGLALIAIFVIVILVDDDGPSDDAVVVVSAPRDGDVVLINDPLEVRVSVRDAQPVSSIALSVNGTLVQEQQPVADPGSGTFSVTLSWVPDSLGTVTLTITAINVSGEESRTELRIRVTDDPAELPADLRVQILTPAPLQRVAVNQPVIIRAEAESDEPIASFTLEVDGVFVADVDGQESGDGRTQATLAWAPTSEGLSVLRVSVRTASGLQDSTEITVEVVGDASISDTPPAEDDEQQADGAATVTISSPSNNAEFELSDDLSIDVVISVSGDVTVTSLELYVSSQFVASVEPNLEADGTYSQTIAFEPSQPGAYSVEVVAITASGETFRDSANIQILDPQAQVEAANLPDLVPVAVTTTDNNAIGLTIRNDGDADLPPTPVLVSVVRASDGILLDEATINLAIAAGAQRVTQLPIVLAETLAITIIVDTNNVVEESNEDNNEIRTTFVPVARPDLVLQALELGLDGLPFVRIGNIGPANFSGRIVVHLSLNGVIVDQLAFTGPLAVGGSLTLPGNAPIVGTGELIAIVDPLNVVAEANETNNAAAITIGP